jgi:hypothetical protein
MGHTPYTGKGLYKRGPNFVHNMENDIINFKENIFGYELRTD